MDIFLKIINKFLKNKKSSCFLYGRILNRRAMNLLIKLAKQKKLNVFVVFTLMTLCVMFTIVQSGVIANLMSFTFHLNNAEFLTLSEEAHNNIANATLLEKISRIIEIAVETKENKARKLTEFLLTTKDFVLISALGAMIFLSIALTQFLFFLKDYSIHQISVVFMAQMRKMLFSTFLSLPIETFRNKKSGDLIARALLDVEQIGTAMREFLEGIVYGLFLSIVGFIAMYLIDKRLTFILLVAAVFLSLAVQITSSFLHKISRLLQKKLGDISQYIQESLYSIDIIKVYTREKWENKKFDSFIKNYLSLGLKQALIFQLIRPVTEIIGVFGVICIFFYAASLIWQKLLTIEKLFGFLIIVMYVIPYLQRLTKAIFVQEQINASAERIMEILDLKKEDYRAENSPKLDHYQGNLTFSNVSFSYDTMADSQQIIKSVDLHIKSRETVALVGQSGGGKTTLISLIPQLLRPTSGKILFDDIPHDEISLFELRQHIALVTQESLLISASIKENIRYGRIEASDEEVLIAAEKAHLNDLIARLPQGIDTIIGERGSTLSGGEKQRLSLARAIIKKPTILLLDEATSALDNESERIVGKAISEIAKECTVIVIAHRLQTISQADKVVVIDDGKIAEIGTHQELLQKDGLYKKFYKNLSDQIFN